MTTDALAAPTITPKHRSADYARMMAVEEDRVLGVGDLVARLPVSESVVRRWIKDGRIRSLKVNGRILVLRADFRRAAERGFSLPEGRVRRVSA